MQKPDTKYFAAAWGFLVWIGLSLLGDRAEAWDSDLYWIVGLPALMAGSAIAGYFTASHPGRMGIWVGVGQGIGVLVSGLMHGGGFGLFPLTLVIVGLFSLPCMIFALIGGLVGKRIRKATPAS